MLPLIAAGAVDTPIWIATAPAAPRNDRGLGWGRGGAQVPSSRGPQGRGDPVRALNLGHGGGGGCAVAGLPRRLRRLAMTAGVQQVRGAAQARHREQSGRSSGGAGSGHQRPAQRAGA